MSEFKNGAAIDTRPLSEKKKDFTSSEVVASAAVVNWVEKTPAQWRKFPIFQQDGSGSCVAQTEAKEMGIMRFLKDGQYVHFSASDIYQRRSPKTPGMGAINARQIVAEGVTLEVLSPSQNMSDAQMDAVVVEPYKREVGKVFMVPNYLEAPMRDIDAIASTIQATGKGVMVWFFFEINEWTDRPAILNHSLTVDAGLRHSVTAVDFALVNGKKCLIIEDSWGTSFGIAGQRVIDEDFFKVRNWYASYLINFKFDDPVVSKPYHTFNTDMEFGQTNDEVGALQDCLKYEKLFPTNADSTGYFGALTKKAVIAFQAKYGIAQVGRVGPTTRAKLNELYAN